MPRPIKVASKTFILNSRGHAIAIRMVSGSNASDRYLEPKAVPPHQRLFFARSAVKKIIHIDNANARDRCLVSLDKAAINAANEKIK
jgi:hypothetical protein